MKREVMTVVIKVDKNNEVGSPLAKKWKKWRRRVVDRQLYGNLKNCYSTWLYGALESVGILGLLEPSCIRRDTTKKYNSRD